MKPPAPQPCIVVAHPTRQHSHRMAEALEGVGALHTYVTGIPSRGQYRPWMPNRFARHWGHYDLPNIAPHKIKTVPVAPIALNVAQLLPPRYGRAIEYWAYSLFDAISAALVSRAKVELTAVVAYENSAERTFAAARRLGIVTILDAAALHHSIQSPILHEGTGRLEQRIRLQKDNEIRLADHILVTSEFARASYVAAGISAEKIHVALLGADRQFSSSWIKERKRRLVFAFVGTTSFRKGTDVLLAAMLQLQKKRIPADLYLIGHVHGDYREQLRELGPNVSCLGQLGHSELVRTLRKVDCVVLPSRIESFGMSVIEALAGGIPVVVTDHVGAAVAVEEGRTGWIVPTSDVGALADRMQWIVEHSQVLEEMASACRAIAKRFTWDAYDKRVISIFDQILDIRLSPAIGARQ